MIKIYMSNADGVIGYNIDNFVTCFSDICDSHRREKRALLFAFPLYNLRDASVIKVLEDSAYWKSLDEVSGNAISVFVLHFPNSDDKYEKELKSAINELIEINFAIKNDLKSPSILFFQVSGSEVVASYRVPLRSKTIEKTYLEMRAILEAAADAVAKVTPENWKNSEEVYLLAEKVLKERELILFLQRGVGTITSIKKLLNLISGIWDG